MDVSGLTILAIAVIQLYYFTLPGVDPRAAASLF